MKKKIGVITVHGMGDTCLDYSKELRTKLERKIGSIKWENIHFESIYYQNILQDNQKVVWERMEELSSKKLSWRELRKFMLYGFSDGASLEHKADEDNSVYKQTQKIIANSLRNTRNQLVKQDSPVIIIAQSLGGQVLSNYIWDAQTDKGVWDPKSPDYIKPTVKEQDFLRLETMRYLFTTGCNIPLFVAGFDQINAISKNSTNEIREKKMHQDFQWLNYYDKDDVLGWPLQPLSDGYNKLVEDIEIDSGNPLVGLTPFSHKHYWSDRDFINPLVEKITNLLAVNPLSTSGDQPPADG